MNDDCGRQLRRAAFLDRDGVLNVDSGYVCRPGDVVWVEGAIPALKLLSDAGYLVIVVSNQSGIARGYYSEKDVVALHSWMQDSLAEFNVRIDGFFYCPHHPEGTVESYRKVCACRKPMPGLILEAVHEFAIDRQDSFLIGNSETDVQAAQNAGIKGYLFGGSNLYDFVRAFLRERRCYDMHAT